jgi:hypothetical protein
MLELLAAWLAALGTISAVVTALYLAQRDNRIRLRVSAGIRQLILEGGGPGSGTEFVSIDIVNVGRRVGVVTGVSWKFGWFSKGAYLQVPPSNLYSDQFPKKLADGDRAALMIPLTSFRENFRAAAHKQLKAPWKHLRAHSLRVIAHTSAREDARARAEKELSQEVLRLAEGPRPNATT